MFRIYLLFLAAAIGIEGVLGGVVAPVIFHSNAATQALSAAQSGALMSEIFARSGYFLLGCAVFFMLYEAFARQFSRNLRISRIFLALINLANTSAFALYFTPHIIAMQAAGAANGTEFAGIHSAAELVFKIAMLAQAALFFTHKTPQNQR